MVSAEVYHFDKNIVTTLVPNQYGITSRDGERYVYFGLKTGFCLIPLEQKTHEEKPVMWYVPVGKGDEVKKLHPHFPQECIKEVHFLANDDINIVF